ncbi:MAG: DUF2497 domain-containing protein [Rhizobiales bacterium]|nr:DUF2497 domain-containing protein [Hyphomicrobiales bacterium]
MATAKAATEPSMEEILASIRQIIADEDTPAPPAQKATSKSAADDAFDAGGQEMSADDVDALFDAPEELDQSAIDAAFGGSDAGEEMSADDVDALFDSADEADDEDVLDLSMSQTVAADDDISFDVADNEPKPEPQRAAAKPVAPMAGASKAAVAKSAAPVRAEAPLLSSATANAVQSSFGALNSAMNMSSSNTLEDVVKAMMRPLLKQWLDENLPEMVERLVQAEIERMRNP